MCIYSNKARIKLKGFPCKVISLARDREVGVTRRTILKVAGELEVPTSCCRRRNRVGTEDLDVLRNDVIRFFWRPNFLWLGRWSRALVDLDKYWARVGLICSFGRSTARAS